MMNGYSLAKVQLFINNSVFNLSLSDNLLVNLHRFWIY